MVRQRVAERRGFCGALCGMVITDSLDDATEFAVGIGEAGVRLLHMQLADLLTERVLRETECCRS